MTESMDSSNSWYSTLVVALREDIGARYVLTKMTPCGGLELPLLVDFSELLSIEVLRNGMKPHDVVTPIIDDAREVTRSIFLDESVARRVIIVTVTEEVQTGNELQWTCVQNRDLEPCHFRIVHDTIREIDNNNRLMSLLPFAIFVVSFVVWEFFANV